MEAMVKFTKDPFLVKHKAKKWDETPHLAGCKNGLS